MTLLSILALPVSIVLAVVLGCLVLGRHPLPAPVAPSVGAGSTFPASLLVELRQAPTEDTAPLHRRIDELRGELSRVAEQLAVAEEQAEFWRAGGDVRLELINVKLRQVRDGRHVELVELLEDERDILLLRQEG